MAAAALEARALEAGELHASAEKEETSGPLRPPLRPRNWLNLVCYIINLVITYSSLLGIYGATNTEQSRRYQTLVTPEGYAFAIWGPIFFWEGVFAVAQLLPSLRDRPLLRPISPYWWAASAFQVAWTITFAQDQVLVALACMLGILAALLGIAWSTDGLALSLPEFWLLRAPFSLHLGWIIAASFLNASVAADAAGASPRTLLALAVVSLAALLGASTLFALGVRSPDAIVCFVAAWALVAISQGLRHPEALNDPTRANPCRWDGLVLDSLADAALALGIAALLLGLSALAKCCRGRAEA